MADNKKAVSKMCWSIKERSLWPKQGSKPLVSTLSPVIKSHFVHLSCRRNFLDVHRVEVDDLAGGGGPLFAETADVELVVFDGGPLALEPVALVAVAV